MVFLYDTPSDITNVSCKIMSYYAREGMWTRCFPAMRHIRDIIKDGKIGRVVCVQGDFGWSTSSCDPDHRIWYPRSGGMMLDIGMYMAQLGQVAFPDAFVERCQAMGTKKNGVDHTVMASILYGSTDDDDIVNEDRRRGMLQFYVTGEANTEERVTIQGTSGRIVVDPPAHAPTVLRLFTDEGRSTSNEIIIKFSLPDDSFTTWNYPGSVGFTYQVQAVGDALHAGETECPQCK